MAALGVSMAAPASAMGNVSWNDCFGGYAGASNYSASSGISSANTARSGGCGFVGVTLRYTESAPTTITGHTTLYDSIATSRAVVAYGAWHFSQNNLDKRKLT
jgi:hypothetical protein